jgi:hypothetical protein
MASSTIIPKPNNKANSTMKLRVTCVPTMRSAAGKNMKATNILNGTEKRHKECVGYPMKNINTINTRINPIMIELTKSLKKSLF